MSREINAELILMSVDEYIFDHKCNLSFVSKYWFDCWRTKCYQNPEIMRLTCEYQYQMGRIVDAFNSFPRFLCNIYTTY